ncbi:MAG: YkgJ family cysteine cluster protein [Deltaproteobacteria bacterium]|nr:YkgJ family cysteine cluster protein [Deltaproteobacteria bacterium]
MAPEHFFKFNCHPEVPCFTQCCRDITVVLTPYDLLRLKNRLGLRSGDFLDQYTLIIPKAGRMIPMVLLKMREDDMRCPFVTEHGCTVYEDRPWPCRMYPLNTEGDGTYHLITSSERCRGLQEETKWRIDGWLEGQGIAPYEEMNEFLSTVTIPLQVHESQIENPQIAKMVFMSMYNLDKFREFVFNTTFLDRFEVEEPERIQAIQTDDVELLKFAIDWIKFGVFGEKLFWVKEKHHGKSED